MVQSSQRISSREKLILAGLYLSKYDSLGLQQLGFESFMEAFNVIGYALGSRPASIKNYRDEFDPFFPNLRKGWHKRPIREYCLKVYEEYGNLDLESFAGVIKSFVGYDDNVWSGVQPVQENEELYESPSYFSRLATGLAAEQYFESVQPSIVSAGINGSQNRRGERVPAGVEPLRRHTSPLASDTPTAPSGEVFPCGAISP